MPVAHSSVRLGAGHSIKRQTTKLTGETWSVQPTHPVQAHEDGTNSGTSKHWHCRPHASGYMRVQDVACACMCSQGQNSRQCWPHGTLQVSCTSCGSSGHKWLCAQWSVAHHSAESQFRHHMMHCKPSDRDATCCHASGWHPSTQLLDVQADAGWVQLLYASPSKPLPRA
jgi:hypothetical protein